MVCVHERAFAHSHTDAEQSHKNPCAMVAACAPCKQFHSERGLLVRAFECSGHWDAMLSDELRRSQRSRHSGSSSNVSFDAKHHGARLLQLAAAQMNDGRGNEHVERFLECASLELALSKGIGVRPTSALRADIVDAAYPLYANSFGLTLRSSTHVWGAHAFDAWTRGRRPLCEDLGLNETRHAQHTLEVVRRHCHAFTSAAAAATAATAAAATATATALSQSSSTQLLALEHKLAISMARQTPRNSSNSNHAYGLFLLAELASPPQSKMSLSCIESMMPCLPYVAVLAGQLPVSDRWVNADATEALSRAPSFDHTLAAQPLPRRQPHRPNQPSGRGLQSGGRYRSDRPRLDGQPPPSGRPSLPAAACRCLQHYLLRNHSPAPFPSALGAIRRTAATAPRPSPAVPSSAAASSAAAAIATIIAVDGTA